MQSSIENVGDVGHRQIVQVAQRQHQAVLRRQLLEHGSGRQRIQLHVPRVFVFRLARRHRAQVSVLTRLAPPVVHQFVSSNADQPRSGRRRGVATLDRIDGGEERLRGELLGQSAAAAAREQVPVHVWERRVIDREEPRRVLFGC